MQTFFEALAEATARLLDAGSATATLDATLLLSEATGHDKLYLHTHTYKQLDSEAYARFEELLRRREVGEPMAYILGTRGFWALELAVRPGVLIPRPDSETLVEAVLAACPDKTVPLKIADLGVGSGALILSLLSEYPNARGWGTDVADTPLEVTAQNAETHGLAARLTLIKGSWAEPLPGGYDVIVSNPPYITTAEMATLARDVVNFEPTGALHGGDDGLDAYRALLPTVADKLAPGGLLCLEVGHTQARAVSTLLEEQEIWHTINTHNDLAHIARVVSAVRR